MPRSGTHAHPPARLPGESHDEYLHFIRNCPVDYSDYVAPQNKSDHSRANKTQHNTPKGKRVRGAAKPTTLLPRTCPECSINFSTVYITKVYCSEECSVQNYNTRKRSQYQQRAS